MYQAITQEGQAIININIPREELIIDKENKSNKLGEGSFGVVYKGKRGHIDVAVKELKLFGEIPETIIDEFKKEALIMLQLGFQCPNLVQIHGICYEQPYSLVMELFTEGNLYGLLKKRQDLTWLQKEKIATDVAVGLNFLHKNKIIHRDIKSMNILLKEDLTAKISDYGLAKVKQHTISSTASKGAVGTIPWMAPELFKKKPVYSEASDIYSYGLVLWEMATHQLPFSDCESQGILINEIINGDIEPVPETTPATFAKLINYCTDKDPQKRPTTSIIINNLQNPQNILLFSNISIKDNTSLPKSRPLAPSTIQSKAYIPSPRTSQIMEYFLKHVGYGEQKEAEAMLKANRNLALSHGDLTDCSIDPETNTPRTWHNITAYQYAILVLDYHMWTMIQKFMNPEEIREQLEELNNFATLKEDGWIINSNNSKWPSVGWKKLIEALDTYVTYYQVWRDSQCRKHWCQQVGGAQLMLPAHIINEYRYPNRPFYPCPKWGDNEEILPRTGVDKWREIGYIPYGNNNDVVKYILGESFAWCNGNSAQISSWGNYSNSKTIIGVKPHVGGHISCNGSIQEDIKAKIEEKQKHSRMPWSEQRGDNFFWSENTRDNAKYEHPKAIIENLMPIADDRAALHELLIARLKQARSLVERQLLNKTCKLQNFCI